MNSIGLTGTRLSSSETKFITDGISQGLRSDGRGLFDLRHVHIKTGLLPQANGSARVKTMFSSTDILCGVKFEVGSYDEPPIQCSVELGALARADLFGPIEASKRAERRGIELADALARWLEGTLELPSLIQGKARWITFVDCVVLGDGGNLQDALSLSCYCALRDARLPETSVNEDGTDFDINADFNAAKPVDHSLFAITCTCWFVSGNIICDPTPEEEACAECAVLVNVDRRGRIRIVSKTAGSGSVQAETLARAVSVASNNARQLLKFVDSELDAEASAYESRIGKIIVQDPDSWDEVCLSKAL